MPSSGIYPKLSKLEGLPNKVMASEYRTALPQEKELAAEIERTRALLQARQKIPAATVG